MKALIFFSYLRNAIDLLLNPPMQQHDGRSCQVWVVLAGGVAEAGGAGTVD